MVYLKGMLIQMHRNNARAWLRQSKPFTKEVICFHCRPSTIQHYPFSLHYDVKEKNPCSLSLWHPRWNRGLQVSYRERRKKEKKERSYVWGVTTHHDPPAFHRSHFSFFSFIFSSLKNMEHITNFHVILVQGPRWSLYYVSLSVCTAKASTSEAGCSQEEGPKKGFVMGSRTWGVQEILEKCM